MDMNDPQVKAALAGRLDEIRTTEAGDAAHQPLRARDLGFFAFVCAALVVLGLVVTAL
jgi:hypothetical protein